MKTITLVSSDNERFEVSEAAASLSLVIRDSIEYDPAGRDSITVSKVTGEVLAKLLEYCNRHAPAAGSKTTGAATGSSGGAASCNEAAEGSSEADGAAASGEDDNEDLKSFDAAFVDVDQSVLYDLIKAADFLEIRGLLDLVCQKVADMISGKAPEEIRKMLGIKDDFPQVVVEEEENQCF